jgi:hypothetical protein
MGWIRALGPLVDSERSDLTAAALALGRLIAQPFQLSHFSLAAILAFATRMSTDVTIYRLKTALKIGQPDWPGLAVTVINNFEALF